jgi:hypothetical protein
VSLTHKVGNKALKVRLEVGFGAGAPLILLACFLFWKKRRGNAEDSADFRDLRYKREKMVRSIEVQGDFVSFSEHCTASRADDST